MTITRMGRIRLSVVLAVALVFILTLWLTAIWTEDASLKEIRDQARHNLDLFITHLQGELAKYEFLPELLASKDSFLALLMNPGDTVKVAFTNQYLKKINDITNASDIYLMNTSGLTVAASNWDSERPFVGKNFNFRPYFQEAMKGRLGRYFALGVTSNKRGYYFAYPVRHDANILGVVVVKVRMDTIETIWRSGKATEFIVTDPDGIIFLTTKPEWKFRSFHALTPEVLQQIKKSRRYGDAEISPLPVISERTTGKSTSIFKLREVDPSSGSLLKNRESDYLKQDVEIAESGWTIHVLSRLDPVRLQVHKNMLLVGITFLLLVVITLFSIQRKKRIREKIHYEQRERKAVESSEARIRAILQNTRAGLIAMDGKGDIEFFNPMAVQMFGYGFREVMGNPLKHFIHEGDSEACLKQLVSSTQCNGKGKNAPTLELCGRRKDGSIFPLELTISQMPVGDGFKYIATIFDITDRKLNEEALRESKKFLQDILDSIQDGVSVLDNDLNIIQVNSTMEKWYSHQLPFIGKKCYEVYHGRTESCEVCPSMRTLSSGKMDYEIVPYKGPEGGTGWLELFTFPLINSETGNNAGVIEYVRNVTDRKLDEEAIRLARDKLEKLVQERTADLILTDKRLSQEIEKHTRTEENLHKTQEELIQAAKLAGLGQMSAAISHELNQPLSAIRSYADNARALLDRERKDDVRWNLSQISDLTARMAQITKQLKTFSRKSTEEPVAVSLLTVFSGALGILNPRIKREGIKIMKELPSKDLFVLGDLVRLEQVFVNIISNSLQAMSNGRQRTLHLNAGVKDNNVVVTIRDTGSGIPHEQMSQIFEPFFTTKETGQGLGLGLSISSRIIESLGGTIKAENHPEGGAVFTVELPRASSVEGDGI